MLAYESLAEKKISQAIKRGEFSGLNGQEKPLKPDDGLYVPESLRLGFRILKNAGMTPCEAQVFKEIKILQQKLIDSDDINYRSMLVHQLAWLRTKQSFR